MSRCCIRRPNSSTMGVGACTASPCAASTRRGGSTGRAPGGKASASKRTMSSSGELRAPSAALGRPSSSRRRPTATLLPLLAAVCCAAASASRRVGPSVARRCPAACRAAGPSPCAPGSCDGHPEIHPSRPGISPGGRFIGSYSGESRVPSIAPGAALLTCDPSPALGCMLRKTERPRLPINRSLEFVHAPAAKSPTSLAAPPPATRAALSGLRPLSQHGRLPQSPTSRPPTRRSS